jgi:hypothetical protein
MRQVNGVVTPRRRHPRRTGMVRDLYRVEGVAEENSQDLEIKFMSPLDNGGAVVLERLIAGMPLDTEQRLAWARYLLSMLYRHPVGVETIKTHVAEMWREGTDALEADFAKMQAARGLPITTLAEETAKRHHRQQPRRAGYRSHALDMRRCQPVEVFAAHVGSSARDVFRLGGPALLPRAAAVA